MGFYTKQMKWNDAFQRSEVGTKKLIISKLLRGHKHIHSLDFNSTGELLVAGTNEKIFLWNWSLETMKLKFRSKHVQSIIKVN